MFIKGELLPREPKVTSKAYGFALWSLEGPGMLCVGLSQRGLVFAN